MRQQCRDEKQLETAQEKDTASRVECRGRVLELKEHCTHDDSLDQERPATRCQNSISHTRQTVLTRSWLPLLAYCLGVRVRGASSTPELAWVRL